MMLRRPAFVSVALAVALLVGPVVTRGPAAQAAPVQPAFGSAIDPLAGYVGQSTCDPTAKPGTIDLRDLLEATYPTTSSAGIGRECGVGGVSEHKEGRAYDWAVDAGVPAQNAMAEDFLTWLLAPDSYGNKYAMARRLGIMYVIWNRRIWSTWDEGWDVYCVQKKRKCKDPDSKAEVHPHTDHVHISLSWDGAKMETSYWNNDLSFDGPPPAEQPPPAETPPPAQESPPPSPD